MTEARSDLWHVQLASGDVLVMNLDELDEAFNRGRIDESTMVLQGGTLKWARLGEILGEEEEPALPTATFNPTPTPIPSRTAFDGDSMTPSVRPMAYDVEPSSTDFGDDDFDPDMLSLRPSKKKFVFAGLGIVAAIALGVVGLSKVAASANIDAQAANASITQAAAAAAPAPPPKATPASDTVNVDALPGSRLSDDQKAALSKLDKKLSEQQAAKEAALAEKAAKRAAKHHGKVKGGKTGFHEGGDPHDPLNAKLNSKSKGW